MILKDKRILITGGARGLGRNFAECAIADGAKVVIADLLEDLGRETADAIGATFVPVDLAKPDSIEACVAAAAKHLGGIDGLVNNGAITNSGGKTLDQLEIEIWDRVMTVNVRGTWLMTKAARPHLAKCGKGKVVNIASDTALWGAPKIMAYVASKGAVIAMTRGLAREMGRDGITVNALAPGFTLSENVLASEEHVSLSSSAAVTGRAIPRDEKPEDLVGAVSFLASDDAEFMTGQTVVVDGGSAMV